MADHHLRDIALFSDLPAATVSSIEEKCRWLTFVPDDLVFDRESDSIDVYFVVSGRVRILDNAVPDRNVALADISAGSYFGELAAIDGMRRSARVVALEESVLAALDGQSFIDLMRTHPSVAVKLLEKLSRIIRDLDRRVVQVSSQTETQRVCSQLVRLAVPDQGPHWIIRDFPNHKEIADWSGTSREQVAQTIGDLARDGVVRRRSRDLIIHDLPKLQVISINLKSS